jgi:hypothetical protein
LPKVLFSYRRSDTAHVAGRIFDKLVARYGAENVFMDISNTPLGIDFREHIAEVFGQGDILVALIGRQWVGAGADGGRRIERANDMVRIEIETALQRKIPLIPVLIDDAPMPQPSDLPPSIEALAYRHAAELDSFRDFHPHMDRLIEAMDELAASRIAEGNSESTAKQSEVLLEPPTDQSPAKLSNPVEPAVPSSPVPNSSSGDAKTIFGGSRAASVDPPPHRTLEQTSPPSESRGSRPAVRLSNGFNEGSLPASTGDMAVRAMRWVLLILLVLMAVRSLWSLGYGFGLGGAMLALPTWLLLVAYYLWQVPLAWAVAALFLGWEFLVARALSSPETAATPAGGLGIAAWPYTTLLRIRAVALGGDAPVWPVVTVFIGFFVVYLLPRLIGLMVTVEGTAVIIVLRMADLVWTVTLFVMILRIGRSPAFRKS